MEKLWQFSQKAIFICVSVWSRTRFEWEIYWPMSHRKILQELENLLKKDEIKRLFCAEYKEICKECDYRYICGGRCMAIPKNLMITGVFSFKSKIIEIMMLFYYDSKENRRKNLRNLY